MEIIQHLCQCGCGNPVGIATKNVTAYGWIKGQPKRFIRGHNPTPKRPDTLLERFYARIDKSGGPYTCWEWQGSKSGAYGVIWGNGKQCLVHRVAWELANGPIPNGLAVCHKCDNPPCCNPAHLFVGTDLDNMRDKVAKGRHRGNAKMTVESIEAIRSKYAAGIRQVDLMREYGLTRGTIWCITKGKTWRK